MKRRVRSVRVQGPFEWWADLFPAPVGFTWKLLTSLSHKGFNLQCGGSVVFPMPYLVPLPQVRQEKWWEHQRRIDQMIEDDTRNQKPDKWTPGNEPMLQPYPTVYQYCTDCWSKKDGKVVPRTPCTISLTFFSGSVNLSINDKDRSRSFHTSAETVTAALEALEAHLAAGNTPWRYWKGK